MTYLHTAIRTGDTEKALRIIKGKIWTFRKTISYFFDTAIVNAKNFAGESPLHLAVKYYAKNPAAYKIILQELLRAGAKKEVIDADGVTPLHIAASNGHADIVAMLLQSGAAINYYANNMTALGCAAAKGHNDVIKILLEHNARLQIDDSSADSPVTPMQAAAASGKLETLQFLMSHGGNVNEITIHNQIYCRTPLWYALDYGFKTTPNDFSIAKFLLENNADPNQTLNLNRSAHVKVMALNLKMRDQVDLISEAIKFQTPIQEAFIQNEAGDFVRYQPQLIQSSRARIAAKHIV